MALTDKQIHELAAQLSERMIANDREKDRERRLASIASNPKPNRRPKRGKPVLRALPRPGRLKPEGFREECLQSMTSWERGVHPKDAEHACTALSFHFSYYLTKRCICVGFCCCALRYEAPDFFELAEAIYRQNEKARGKERWYLQVAAVDGRRIRA